MHEPRIGAHNLGQMRQEGDDVMLGDRLDGVDAGDSTCLSLNGGGALPAGDTDEFQQGSK